MNDLNKEINRKLVHFLGIGYILGYWFLPRNIILWIMGSIALAIILTEFVRLTYSPLNRWILSIPFFGGQYRPNELHQPSGLTYTFTGAFLTMLLFKNKAIILNALWFQVFGDGMAAIIGMQFGKTFIGKKSLEGSIACFLTCFVFSFCFFDPQIALLGALFATIIELFPFPKPFDNFWLPFASALSLKYLVKFLS